MAGNEKAVFNGNMDHWLKIMGNFSITVRGDEIKGTLAAEWGQDGTAYFDAQECRGIAAAFAEVANILEQAASCKNPMYRHEVVELADELF